MSSDTQWTVTKVQLYWSETHWRGRVERHNLHAQSILDWDLADDGAPFLGDRPACHESVVALHRIAAKVGVEFVECTYDPREGSCVSEGPFDPLAAELNTDVGTHRMLKWFKYDHLPVHLQAISRPFLQIAQVVDYLCEPGPERTVALRKLLEAKDAAVRARLHPGG
jgi:hypothetical protein